MQVHSFRHLSFSDEASQRIVMFGTDMNEMNIQPINLDDELRERIQFRLILRTPCDASAMSRLCVCAIR